MARDIDVLMLVQQDFANTGFRFWRCLRLLGLRAEIWKRYKHSFEYPKQAPLWPRPGNSWRGGKFLTDKVKRAKVVHFTCSRFFSNVRVTPKSQHVIMQHGGTAYRRNHVELNQSLNPIVSTTIIQTPDLLGLGAKNEVYVVSPVDTRDLVPVFKRYDRKRLLIGHFPSSPRLKGTSGIEDVMRELETSPLGHRFKYVGSSEKVSWAAQLNRVRKCDILIETCESPLDRRPCREWGNTALEGAALGKIVVTNAFYRSVYERSYGPIGLQVANSPTQLRKVLVRLLELSDREIAVLKQATREWVVSKHSLEVTAERLWKKVYSKFGSPRLQRGRE